MKWFVNCNDIIQGPFDNTEVPTVLKNVGTQSTFLWSRGMSDWIHADKWSPSIAKSPEYERNFASMETHISPASAHTTLGAPRLNIATKYKVQYDFKDQKEMTYEQLVQFTMQQSDVSKIAVYDPATQEWREIYAIPEVVERLGLSRRKNSRVPILAQFSGQSGKEQKINCRVVTISVAGFGFTNIFDLSIGDVVRGQITSPHFFTPLNVEAEVTYTGSDGYIGLRFSQINDDTLALITEYVNKFGDKTEIT